MKISQFALLLLLTSVLSACATTPGSELDSGKLEYANVDVTWPNDQAPQPANFSIYRITPKIIAENSATFILIETSTSDSETVCARPWLK